MRGQGNAQEAETSRGERAESAMLIVYESQRCYKTNSRVNFMHTTTAGMHFYSDVFETPFQRLRRAAVFFWKTIRVDKLPLQNLSIANLLPLEQHCSTDY